MATIEDFQKLDIRVGKIIVHPILVIVKNDKIKLDREAVNYKWIKPREAKKLKLLPGFEKVLKKISKL